MVSFIALALLALPTTSPAQNSDKIPDELLRLARDPQLAVRRAKFKLMHFKLPDQAVFQHLEPLPQNVVRKQADLRPKISNYGIEIQDQGNRNTCSVFALCFIQEYAAARQTGRKNIHFSEEYLNYAGNLAIGQFVDGGFFADLDNGYKFYGHIPYANLQYHDPIAANVNQKAHALLPTGENVHRFTGTFIKPWDNTTGPTTAEINQACDELDKGNPVAAGFLWPNNGAQKQKVIGGVDMMLKIPRSDVNDGHSVALVGYQKGSQFPGGGYFIFRNSWGKGWGDKGYGYMSFDYAKAYDNDMIVYH